VAHRHAERRVSAADVDDEDKSIVAASSKDGISWSPWQVAYTDGGDPRNPIKGNVFSPSLMALEGDDDEVLGETFAVMYQYRGPGTVAPHEFNYVNVTVHVK